MKDEGYMREQASAKFTKDYANNEAAVKLLDKTIVALQEAYPHSFAQVEQAPEFGDERRADVQDKTSDFAKYEKNGSGNTVVTALEKIKNDINKSMTDAVAQETAEGESYGNTVATFNDQIKTAKNTRAQLKQELAEQDRTHQSTTESKDAHVEEKESEEEALKGKQKSCKFIMENLDIRKTHMDGEIKALQQAREFLNDQTTATGAK